MNDRELQKQYKELSAGAAPEYWDRIEAKLRPHAELTEEERSAFSEAGSWHTDNGVLTIPEERRYREHSGSGKRRWTGWAAAAVLLLLLPAAFYGISGRRFRAASTGELHQEAAAAEIAAETAAGWTAAAAETVPNLIVSESIAAQADTAAAGQADAAQPAAAAAVKTEQAAEEPAAVAQKAAAADTAAGASQGASAELRPEETAAAAEEAAAQEGETPRQNGAELLLLSVPADALTVPADDACFTEEVLADTDLLAACHIESAEFEFDSSGRAFRIIYQVTVKDSMLEEGVSGRAGSRIRVCSPIISTASADGKVLYQLIPGADYILPLKRSGGDWELICPYAPQIRMAEDGSFVFHTGYQDLLNAKTEVVFLERASEDDFYYDRMVSRSDPEFRGELIGLIKTMKKNAETP